jgi:hypothetical protein
MLKNGKMLPLLALPKTSKTDLMAIKEGYSPNGM